MSNTTGIKEDIGIPDGINVKIDNGIISVQGKEGTITRNMLNKKISISVNNNKVCFVSERKIPKLKKMLGTYIAHLKNMFKGAKEGHIYTMKICSGHFPMNVSVSKNEFIVKNYIGEKVPRVLRIKDNANVKVDGDFVTIESADKEIAGQVAGDIEQLTKRANYDTRVFQDGIYIINKDGKELK